MDDNKERLISKIKTLSERIWEGHADREQIELWLDNFRDDAPGSPSERLHALHLLSQFMYFGSPQMRELLRAMYRDIFKYPIVKALRKANNDTTDAAFLSRSFRDELEKTRFLGVGNPSESGCHLLYYFRQENMLPKCLFIHTHEIFARTGDPPALSLREPAVERYVFIDDFCGSGEQGTKYSEDIVKALKQLRPTAKVAYCVLFATRSGLQKVREGTLFDPESVKAVLELDSTYKCFSDESRYFKGENSCADRSFAKRMCEGYGSSLFEGDSADSYMSAYPLGYRDGQLMIGFHHNTPDNTLPIFWCDDSGWRPIFRRYPKKYGW